MRQAHVIMSKWLSLPGIFKELSAATQGERRGRGRRREDGGKEPEKQYEWRGAEQMGKVEERRHIRPN